MDFPHQRQPKGPTSVYVVSCVDWVKIGIAKNVHARVIDLQFVCPFAVAIVAQREFQTRKAAMLAERVLHSLFSAQRIHGEWFVLGAEDVTAALVALPEEPQPVTIAGRLRSRKPGVQFGENPPHSFTLGPPPNPKVHGDERMDDPEVVKIIRAVGVGGLGGFDGCYCCGFAIRGVEVDVSCRKGSNMDTIFRDFYGIGVRVHSHSMDGTADVLQAVAREVVDQIKEAGYDIMVRYCSYDQDKNCKCSYCGKPREQAAYLCDKCQTGADAFGDPIAPQYTYDFSGLVFRHAA